MHWFLTSVNVLKTTLEMLYYLVGIGLFATVFIGVKQLKIVQDDIKIRNKRASVEKSIEYLNWFATEFIPKSSSFNASIRQASIAVYKGQINEHFIYDANCDPALETVGKFIDFCGEQSASVSSMINELEYFSAALLSGLADEELAFNPLAQYYCSTIELFYPIICHSRENKHSVMYSNTIGLYKIWRDRLNKNELENKKRDLDTSISKIPDVRIKSIGS